MAGYKAAIQQQLELADTSAFLTGRYVSIGVNNPKKYPNKPFLERTTQPLPIDRATQAKLKYGVKK